MKEFLYECYENKRGFWFNSKIGIVTSGVGLMERARTMASDKKYHNTLIEKFTKKPMFLPFQSTNRV